MQKRFLIAAAVIAATASAASARVTPEQLRSHIDVLASDEYEGRKPGTPGETKTLGYITAKWSEAGLVGGAADGSWYQPVQLIATKPVSQTASWMANGKPLSLPSQEVLITGRQPKVSLANRPVIYAGYGSVEEAASLNLKDAVVLIRTGQPKDRKLPSFTNRSAALAKFAPTAVIGIFEDATPWATLAGYLKAGGNRLADDKSAGEHASGLMSKTTGETLLKGAGATLDTTPGPLPLTASIDITTEIRRYTSHNVVGKLPGSNSNGEAVLLLGHWDHLGICAPDSSTDKICNGAVDNASGIASLIETARALGKGKKLQRDVLFLATTAEEMGLLGAEYFAKSPPVPAEKIVAALNFDTIAVSPKGMPVAILGRGDEALDNLVRKAARKLGRKMDEDGEADSFLARQDGFELAKVGIRSVMVGGSFSDMKLLQTFLGGPYHGPEDNPGDQMVLGGAAEDTDLTIALARDLANPKTYATPAPKPAAAAE